MRKLISKVAVVAVASIAVVGFSGCANTSGMGVSNTCQQAAPAPVYTKAAPIYTKGARHHRYGK
ncbi:MAG: hypothetical protein KIT27_10425 [Legionellales bacterium]|nr:hypothetical protein [Legionellales bacterium]